jgi:hypothetical protein
MRLVWPVMRMLTSRPSDAICELVGPRPYRFVEGRRETTFASTDTLDQLLLRRFGGKVRRGNVNTKPGHYRYRYRTVSDERLPKEDQM